MLLRAASVVTLLLFAYPLTGVSKSAEPTTAVETPKRTSIVPKQTTKPRNPRDEREKKEKAAAEEAAFRKQQAAEELKYRREADQKQIEIQDRIAQFTGSLVTIGYWQVGIAIIGLFAIGIAFKAARAAEESSRTAREALEIAQRAKVQIRDIHIGKEGVSGKPIIGYTLHNIGNSPASGIVDSFFTREGLGLNFEWPNRPRVNPSIEHHRIIIEPGAEYRSWHYLIDPDRGQNFAYIRPDHWEEMLKGSIQIQMGICIAYWDGFHHQRISETWISRNPESGNWQTEIVRQD